MILLGFVWFPLYSVPSNLCKSYRCALVLILGVTCMLWCLEAHDTSFPPFFHSFIYLINLLSTLSPVSGCRDTEYSFIEKISVEHLNARHCAVFWGYNDGKSKYILFFHGAYNLLRETGNKQENKYLKSV